MQDILPMIFPVLTDFNSNIKIIIPNQCQDNSYIYVKYFINNVFGFNNEIIIMNDKKSVDEKLSEALDTEFESEAKQIESKRKVTQIQVNAPDSEKDYWLVRKNMKELIKQGEEAIDGILNVAVQGDAPRAYEVAAQMIKTVADVNKDLIDLHKKVKEINKEEVNINNTTNQSIYVGSTSDLQDLINQERSRTKAMNRDIIDTEIVDDK